MYISCTETHLPGSAFTFGHTSTLVYSPSTPSQSLCLWLACSCSYHLFSLCLLTTFIIYNSLILSPPAQNLYLLPQIFPTIDFLPASRLAPRTLWLDRFFWAPCFLCYSFLHYCFSFLVLCGRLSWLFFSFWAHINIVHRIVSCHTMCTVYNVSCRLLHSSVCD